MKGKVGQFNHKDCQADAYPGNSNLSDSIQILLSSPEKFAYAPESSIGRLLSHPGFETFHFPACKIHNQVCLGSLL